MATFFSSRHYHYFVPNVIEKSRMYCLACCQLDAYRDFTKTFFCMSYRQFSAAFEDSVSPSRSLCRHFDLIDRLNLRSLIENLSQWWWVGKYNFERGSSHTTEFISDFHWSKVRGRSLIFQDRWSE